MRRVIAALFGTAALIVGLLLWLGLERAYIEAHGWVGVAFGVLCVGFPALYYSCKRQLWETWRFMLIGGIGGVLWSLPFSSGLYSYGLLLLLFVMAGAFGGWLFWVAAIWRNDDLTCPKSFCLPCGKAYQVARKALGRR